MDFFQAQEDARRKTRTLGVFFILSVIGVMLSVGCLTTLLLGKTFNLELFSMGALGAAAVVIVPTMFKSLQLRSGGDVVAQDLGGRLIDSRPSDFHERRLLNVVEEMALASGQPVPHLYVMDHEDSINAFAAGTEPSNAVIGVTKGCLERLTREELQGVIAHEFSHILNGDMKMNMRMIGWVFGLMAISIIGQMVFRSMRYGRIRTSDQREGGGAVIIMLLLGLGLLVIGSIGVFFGRMLQAAMSRQREFLADASAVQFTRNPDSISNALAKIGGLKSGSNIRHPKAGEASHLFFADGGLFSYGFATHPPLEVRIKRVRKDWDGVFTPNKLSPLGIQKESKSTPIRSVSMLAGSNSGGSSKQPKTHEEILNSQMTQIPQEFSNAAHDTVESQLLILSMLLGASASNDRVAKRAIDQIQPSAQEVITKWAVKLESMHSVQKIALIDLAIPTLRRLSKPGRERFLELTRYCILRDGVVTLFEYLLQQLVERHLLRHARGSTFSKIQYHHYAQVETSFGHLLSAMERFEQDHDDLTENEMQEVRKALHNAEKTSPKLKKELLDRLVHLAKRDGELNNRESELLRVTADAIGCTVPLGGFTISQS